MNITILDKFGSNLSATTLSQLAGIAETAELYHDCYRFMSELVRGKSQPNSTCTLDVDQRGILSVAVKNIIGNLRASLRSLPDSDDTKTTSEEQEHYHAYKEYIKVELKQFCHEYADLLRLYLLPNVLGQADEVEVFYHKALGDTYRYLAEYFDDVDAYKVNAEMYYQTAMQIAMQNLNETHPTRLGLALNFSVFYTEIMKDAQKGCKLAKYAFDSSIEKLDTLNDASYKDSTLVMQLLRDNLTQWTDGADAADMAGDDCIAFAVGGARDVNNFRECVQRGVMPQIGSLSHNGLLYEYYFDTKKKPKQHVQVDDGSMLFYPSYCYARVNKLALGRVDEEKKPHEEDEGMEYYMTVGLNSNIKQKDFKRKLLNLVIVLDKSGSMSDCFDDERSAYYQQFNDDEKTNLKTKERKRVRTKMEVANECIVGLLQHLTPKDRFGFIVFDHEAAIRHSLTMLGDLDKQQLEQLKTDILSVSPSGGTDFECGFQAAINDMYLKHGALNDEEYDNRLVFLTDAQPNSGATDAHSLLSMVREHANNAQNHIYSTFIGVGLDFNAKLVEQISSARGCNYFTVQSTHDFERVMCEEFDFMVTPLVFGVSLTLKSEGDVCCIDRVYGTAPQTEESMIESGQMMKIDTLFPSKQSAEKGGSKGGIQLIKLKRNKRGKMNVELEVQFEDKYGKTYKNVQNVTLDAGDDEHVEAGQGDGDMIESNAYFENSGIRKGVLLCKYVDLMQAWMKHEEESNGVRGGDALSVSDEYQQVFTAFIAHFEHEMKELKDDELLKEVELIKKLANSNDAQQIQ